MDLPRSCVILTGPRGSGKTSAMTRIVGALASSGARVSALLQPDSGRRPDGFALGFAMEFLTGVEGKLLARRVDLARELKEGELPTAAMLALGRFVFDRAPFEKAGEFIASAAAGGVDVLGLDEIGRLELLRGEGLMACLELALAAVAGVDGPRVLICSAREDSVVELHRMAQASGLRSLTFEVSKESEALDAVKRALGH